MTSARLDTWMWAVRLYKTRSKSKAAVVGGHVRVNGASPKPAHQVKAGDRVEATQTHRVRVVDVVEPIAKRVGAARAAECFVDHSPPPPVKQHVAPAGHREPGSGRPTKKDRRQLNRLRRR